MNQRFGDYRLIRSLGKGTFGEVHQGEHIYRQTPVAVKVFKSQLTPGQFRDFLNEVRTILLKHPHIVQILDFGMGEDDIPYLVMEYAPHGTLLQRHPRGTPLSLPLILTYTTQIAEALQYAHDQRCIHRDVKPENLLFAANDMLVLADFGIAAVAHNLSSLKTTGPAGTPRYMAPEQWMGKSVPASDQYALAVMVYEWITGTCPFVGSHFQLQYQHLHASPPSLCENLPAISPHVEDVILQALAKKPADRFSTIQHFADALRSVVQQQTPVPPQHSLASQRSLQQNAASVPASLSQMSMVDVPTVDVPLPTLPLPTSRQGKSVQTIPPPDLPARVSSDPGTGTKQSQPGARLVKHKETRPWSSRGLLVVGTYVCAGLALLSLEIAFDQSGAFWSVLAISLGSDDRFLSHIAAGVFIACDISASLGIAWAGHQMPFPASVSSLLTETSARLIAALGALLALRFFVFSFFFPLAPRIGAWLWVLEYMLVGLSSGVLQGVCSMLFARLHAVTLPLSPVTR